MYKYFFFLFVVFTTTLSAQDIHYQSLLIKPELTADANAVVRNEEIEIEIEAVDKLTIRTRRVITVLNEHGENHIEAYDFYDDNSKIKNQEAIIYDKLGNEIKKFKKKHFEDRSAVGSGTLISDDRVKYMEYTAREYPYTVVYESEVQKNSTVFVQAWKPIAGYYLSVERSSYILKNPAGIPLRYEEKNLSGIEVEKSTSDFELSYSVQNLPAYNYERLSPSINNFSPHVLVALNEFSLVGVQGQATSWSEFGKWQYDHLLKGRTTLSPETIAKISTLTSDAEDNIEKARRIYQYVQDNTRYISVQLGIGGWQPMDAVEVDQVRYGDCKALTNYTKALLESQQIQSYYTVVYGGEDKTDIDKDFPSMQGNHVILNIPSEGEDIWLECTSQTTPFNYLGDFTDNRNVLIIKPEGGEIARTKIYQVHENLQETFSTITLDEKGAFNASLKRRSKGVAYGEIYHINRQTEKDQTLYYKRNWGHFKNMNLEEMAFTNDRDDQEFTEDLKFSGDRFTSKAGNRLLLPLNFLIPETYNLPRNEKRKLPLEISRGRTFEDTFEYLLPAGFEPESIPEYTFLETDFGTFELSVVIKAKEGAKTIQVKRKYVINEGLWPAESYGDFRNFMYTINSLSNQKAVIVATQ
ncbi:hypothetical protein GCM10007103_05120 [Salinimicrobium marinum]|uniref:DUF3857 domain-containing protein n=2 Tax=Salinimicrobium marinum TaxID=680283 RepID=A0A918VVH2_9FLAO|nr:hypothetical protein GCM10007103_05120 [Salinimicrobium marinum]